MLQNGSPEASWKSLLARRQELLLELVRVPGKDNDRKAARKTIGKTRKKPIKPGTILICPLLCLLFPLLCLLLRLLLCPFAFAS